MSLSEPTPRELKMQKSATALGIQVFYSTTDHDREGEYSEWKKAHWK
jgi:hypothetical protein